MLDQYSIRNELEWFRYHYMVLVYEKLTHKDKYEYILAEQALAYEKQLKLEFPKEYELVCQFTDAVKEGDQEGRAKYGKELETLLFS